MLFIQPAADEEYQSAGLNNGMSPVGTSSSPPIPIFVPSSSSSNSSPSSTPVVSDSDGILSYSILTATTIDRSRDATTDVGDGSDAGYDDFESSDDEAIVYRMQLQLAARKKKILSLCQTLLLVVTRTDRAAN